MKAAIFYPPKKIKIEEIKTPEIKSREVLVEIIAAGICGSDVCFYKEGKIGNIIVKSPIILGHECSGRVVFSMSKKFAMGDRVVIEPGFPCRTCEFCKTGKYNLCRDMNFLGTYPKDGVFAEYVAAPEDCVFKIPDNVSFEEALLVEPVAVAIHAIKRGKICLGETVAIIGSGPIGLITLQVVRILGVSKIYVIDLEEFRLRKAIGLGADVVINANKKDDIKEILKLTQNCGVDVAIEAVGNSITINKAIKMVRPGGRVVLIGTGVKSQLKINTSEISSKELDFLGVWRYLRNFPDAIRLIANKQINTREIITHKFLLEKIEEAMILTEKKNKVVKIIFLMKKSF